jgi:hypothetical protein
MHDTGAEAIYQLWVGIGANAIEAIAVALIVGYFLIATVGWLMRALSQRRFTLEHYKSFAPHWDARCCSVLRSWLPPTWFAPLHWTGP